jgi:hypothetical protein
VKSESGSGGGDYGNEGTGDYGAPPPVEVPPGGWSGYAPGHDANALAAAFNDAWSHRPEGKGERPADAKIVVHGYNPITGYSVIMIDHGGGG